MPLTGAICPTCGWVLHRDGVCVRCPHLAARPAESRPCPPYASWPRTVRAAVFEAVVERTMTSLRSAVGDGRQRVWEMWLRTYAVTCGAVLPNEIDLSITAIYDRVLAHHHAPGA